MTKRMAVHTKAYFLITIMPKNIRWCQSTGIELWGYYVPIADEDLTEYEVIEDFEDYLD